MLFHAFSWGPIVFQRLWGLRTYSNAKKSAERSTRLEILYRKDMGRSRQSHSGDEL